ncbi:transposable element Tcb2 transposase [Trichonephila clavipes]|nr:transposable element Tcb2 transposase [Trichonephila clavipes]
MNPIEHVWDSLGRRVTGRQPPPQTLEELERALLEEWVRISQLVINSLIDSMPHDSTNQYVPQDMTREEFYFKRRLEKSVVHPRGWS